MPKQFTLPITMTENVTISVATKIQPDITLGDNVVGPDDPDVGDNATYRLLEVPEGKQFTGWDITEGVTHVINPDDTITVTNVPADGFDLTPTFVDLFAVEFNGSNGIVVTAERVVEGGPNEPIDSGDFVVTGSDVLFKFTEIAAAAATRWDYSIEVPGSGPSVGGDPIGTSTEYLYENVNGTLTMDLSSVPVTFEFTPSGGGNDVVLDLNSLTFDEETGQQSYELPQVAQDELSDLVWRLAGDVIPAAGPGEDVYIENDHKLVINTVPTGMELLNVTLEATDTVDVAVTLDTLPAGAAVLMQTVDGLDGTPTGSVTSGDEVPVGTVVRFSFTFQNTFFYQGLGYTGTPGTTYVGDGFIDITIDEALTVAVNGVAVTLGTTAQALQSLDQTVDLTTGEVVYSGVAAGSDVVNGWLVNGTPVTTDDEQDYWMAENGDLHIETPPGGAFTIECTIAEAASPQLDGPTGVTIVENPVPLPGQPVTFQTTTLGSGKAALYWEIDGVYVKGTMSPETGTYSVNTPMPTGTFSVRPVVFDIAQLHMRAIPDGAFTSNFVYNRTDNGTDIVYTHGDHPSLEYVYKINSIPGPVETEPQMVAADIPVGWLRVGSNYSFKWEGDEDAYQIDHMISWAAPDEDTWYATNVGAVGNPAVFANLQFDSIAIPDYAHMDGFVSLTDLGNGTAPGDMVRYSYTGSQTARTVIRWVYQDEHGAEESLTGSPGQWSIDIEQPPGNFTIYPEVSYNLVNILAIVDGAAGASIELRDITNGNTLVTGATDVPAGNLIRATVTPWTNWSVTQYSHGVVGAPTPPEAPNNVVTTSDLTFDFIAGSSGGATENLTVTLTAQAPAPIYGTGVSVKTGGANAGDAVTFEATADSGKAIKFWKLTMNPLGTPEVSYLAGTMDIETQTYELDTVMPAGPFELEALQFTFGIFAPAMNQGATGSVIPDSIVRVGATNEYEYSLTAYPNLKFIVRQEFDIAHPGDPSAPNLTKSLFHDMTYGDAYYAADATLDVFYRVEGLATEYQLDEATEESGSFSDVTIPMNGAEEQMNPTSTATDFTLRFDAEAKPTHGAYTGQVTAQNDADPGDPEVYTYTPDANYIVEHWLIKDQHAAEFTIVPGSEGLTSLPITQPPGDFELVPVVVPETYKVYGEYGPGQYAGTWYVSTDGGTIFTEKSSFELVLEGVPYGAILRLDSTENGSDGWVFQDWNSTDIPSIDGSTTAVEDIVMVKENVTHTNRNVYFGLNGTAPQPVFNYLLDDGVEDYEWSLAGEEDWQASTETLPIAGTSIDVRTVDDDTPVIDAAHWAMYWDIDGLNYGQHGSHRLTDKRTNNHRLKPGPRDLKCITIPAMNFNINAGKNTSLQVADPALGGSLVKIADPDNWVDAVSATAIPGRASYAGTTTNWTASWPSDPEYNGRTIRVQWDGVIHPTIQAKTPLMTINSSHFSVGVYPLGSILDVTYEKAGGAAEDPKFLFVGLQAWDLTDINTVHKMTASSDHTAYPADPSTVGAASNIWAYHFTPGNPNLGFDHTQADYVANIYGGSNPTVVTPLADRRPGLQVTYEYSVPSGYQIDHWIVYEPDGDPSPVSTQYDSDDVTGQGTSQPNQVTIIERSGNFAIYPVLSAVAQYVTPSVDLYNQIYDWEIVESDGTTPVQQSDYVGENIAGTYTDSFPSTGINIGQGHALRIYNIASDGSYFFYAGWIDLPWNDANKMSSDRVFHGNDITNILGVSLYHLPSASDYEWDTMSTQWVVGNLLQVNFTTNTANYSSSEYLSRYVDVNGVWHDLSSEQVTITPVGGGMTVTPYHIAYSSVYVDTYDNTSGSANQLDSSIPPVWEGGKWVYKGSYLYVELDLVETSAYDYAGAIGANISGSGAHTATPIDFDGEGFTGGVVAGSSFELRPRFINPTWSYDDGYHSDPGYYDLSSIGQGGQYVSYYMIDTSIMETYWPAAAVGDKYGDSVGMSGDGRTVVVGAPFNQSNNEGAGYLHRYTSGSWNQDELSLSGTFSGGNLGDAVAISKNGMYAVFTNPESDGVSNNNGSMEVYEHDGNGIWNWRASLEGPAHTGAEMGRSVAISSDGSVVAFGGPPYGSQNNRGRVDVFEWNGSDYTTLQRTALEGDGTQDFFGAAVDLSDDGSRIIIGAPKNGANAGYSRVYEWTGSWTTIHTSTSGELSNVEDDYGAFVSISGDGNTIATGSPAYSNNGAVANQGYFKIEDISGTPALINDLVGGGAGVQLGPVDLSTDGSRMIAGAPGSNLVRIYQTSDLTVLKTTDNSGDTNSVEFGAAVAISGDGTKYIVGDPSYDTGGGQAGQAFVYNV